MVFIPKDDAKLPDFFTVTVNYLTGRKEVIQVAEFNYVEKLLNPDGSIVTDHYDTFRLWTHDNKFKEIPRASVESIDYDENYTKIVMINRELAQKEAVKK